MTGQVAVDAVCVVVPSETAVIITADGKTHRLEIDANGRRIVWLRTDQARLLLNIGLPCCLQWKSAHDALRQSARPKRAMTL